MDFDALDALVARLKGHGAAPVDIAHALFGPQCIRITSRITTPSEIAFDGAWIIIIRSQRSRAYQRFAVARALGFWALRTFCGPTSDPEMRERAANYIAVALAGLPQRKSLAKLTGQAIASELSESA